MSHAPIAKSHAAWQAIGLLLLHALLLSCSGCALLSDARIGDLTVEQTPQMSNRTGPGQAQAQLIPDPAQTAKSATASKSSAPDPGRSVDAGPVATGDGPFATPDDQHAYAGDSRLTNLAEQISSDWSLPDDWVIAALSQARYQLTAAKLIAPAKYPLQKNWAAYRARFIDKAHLDAGRQFWLDHAQILASTEQKTGVPAAIMVGLLGVETNYGRLTGRYRVLDVLTTLSLDYPKGGKDRSAYFKQELGEFLHLCHQRELPPTQPLGSYAGAMGWPQFMPSAIRKYALQQTPGDAGDLLMNPDDAVASVGNYLMAYGWQANTPTHFPLSMPQDPQARETLLAPDIVPSFTVQQMLDLGAQLDPSGLTHTGLLAAVELRNGNEASSFVAGTRNFYVITRYNQSSYYAMAVIELGETIKREIDLTTPVTAKCAGIEPDCAASITARSAQEKLTDEPSSR